MKRRSQSILITNGAMVIGIGMGGLSVAPCAVADPGFTGTEQQYLSDLKQYDHPAISDMELVGLGNQACAALRSGTSSEDEGYNIQMLLIKSGVNASHAETGGLVHAAVDHLCIDVPYH